MTMINPNDNVQIDLSIKEGTGGFTITIPPGALTVRAELAARAMQGILSNQYFIQLMKDADLKSETGLKYKTTIAKTAVSYADALIEELNKETK